MQQGLELYPEWRYRCFGPREDRKGPCPLPAKYRATDDRRHDAVTFYCIEHAPEGAAPIAEDQTFMEIAVPGLTLIGASTLRHQDGKMEAVLAIQHGLARLGARFIPAEVRAVLKTGRLIVPSRES